MTSNPTSPEPTNFVRTLADALTAVQAADLPSRRRQEIASAVRTIARIFGRPLEEIPAHPSLLAPRLRQVAPVACGISHHRWNNIRSLVRAGLALVQPMSPGRHLNKLSPGWQQRYNQLEDRGLRTALSRFMRFCSALGVDPELVSEKTVESYREHLEQTLKRPHEIFAMTGKAWQRAQGIIPDWPRTVIHVQSRRNQWTLPMSALPESFRTDCEVWLDRLAGRDLLEELSFRPVRPETVDLRRRQLRVFASAVVLRGRNPDTIRSLRDLVEVDTVKEGMRFLLGRSDGKPTSTISHIASALKAVVRHHVRVDAAHLDRLVPRCEN